MPQVASPSAEASCAEDELRATEDSGALVPAPPTTALDVQRTPNGSGGTADHTVIVLDQLLISSTETENGTGSTRSCCPVISRCRTQPTLAVCSYMYYSSTQ